MANVFISHATIDSGLARTLYEALRVDHHDIFLDNHEDAGIQLGDGWESRLYSQLRSADAVVCLVTSAYLSSQWCHSELTMSKALDHRILPLRMEPGIVHPLLTQFQWSDFDPHDATSLDRLCRVLRRIDSAGGTGWDDNKSPFPGLKAFDRSMRSVYFGRGQETRDLLHKLSTQDDDAGFRPLIVVGPSGCGKSSLVNAGLVPQMHDDPRWWVVEPFRPGNQPTRALAAAITSSAADLRLGWTTSQVHGWIEQEPGLPDIAERLAHAAGGPRRVLLVVDQFEEILNLTDRELRRRFFAAVGLGPTSPVRVVATLRSEYLADLMADPDAAGWGGRTFALYPLRRELLSQVITEPARVAGIGVEPELVARLIADTPHTDALPLLSFALAQVATGVTRGGTLSYEVYRNIGGVRGAVSDQADQALADALAELPRDGRDDDQRARTVIGVLIRLVDVDRASNVSRRWVSMSDLTGTQQTQLQPFIKHRLLTISDQAGSIQVGVAHESFFESWEPLRKAISDQQAAIFSRSRIEQQAAEWKGNGQRPEDLLSHRRIVATRAGLSLAHDAMP